MKMTMKITIRLMAFFMSISVCFSQIDTVKQQKLNINHSGEFIIPLIYDEAEPFVYDIATVKKQGKWGVIDTFGKEILPCKYDYIGLNSDRNGIFAFGINGKSGLMRLDGTILLEPQYDIIRTKFDDGFWIYTKNGLDGLLSAAGKVLTPPIYDGWGPGFVHGFQSVRQNGLWGVIDKQGKIIAPCHYSELVAFYHIKDDGTQISVASERALVQINRKFGIIDTLGNTIIPIIYDGIKPLGANPNHSPANCDVNFYAVYSNHQVGVVDKNNKQVLPIAYDAVNLACNSSLFHIYKKRDELCGYATITGKILLEPSLKSAPCRYKEDKAITYKTRWGCEGVGKHPCDPMPLPCFQCEQECPDMEWLKAHGY
jgi:WG containing repeat